MSYQTKEGFSDEENPTRNRNGENNELYEPEKPSIEFFVIWKWYTSVQYLTLFFALDRCMAAGIM